MIEEPHPSALSSARLVLEQALLKKDLKFRAISFGAIILAVFVGGLFIGHAVIKGSPETTASAPPPPPASSVPAPVVAASKPADPPAVAPAAPAKTTTAAVVTEVPKNAAAAPAAAPTGNPNVAGAMAESAVAGTAQMQFDEQPARKRRAHHVVTAPKDDLDPAPAPKRVAAAAPPSVGKTPTAGKAGPKKKSAWHDPFAD